MELPNTMMRAYTSAKDKNESYREKQSKLKPKESNDAQAEIISSEIKEVHKVRGNVENRTRDG